MERGCHLTFHSQLRGLGERRKLPERGPGRSSGRICVLVHLELERTHSDGDKFDIF